MKCILANREARETDMTAYEIAYEAHNEATAIFLAAQAKFRGLPGIATDADFAEFAAAQAAFKVATAEFDIAYEIAANLPEEVEEVSAEDDTQLALFAA
jgi:hypothetical protein